MTVSPGVLAGLDYLRRDNPWPRFPPDLKPFYLSIDGGGRHLVTRAIREHGVSLMVEIGSFLCGSTRQWLDASPDVTVIALDPWDGNWSRYVREMPGAHAAGLDVEKIAGDLLEHGNYLVALNNVREYGERVIPVRRFSPEGLHYLAKRSIRPDLVYIDAFKELDDLAAALELFPEAILCGDDWNWADETGALRMQEHVRGFASEHGMTIEADAATWLLHPGR